jgi:hypothetical protein
MPIVAILKQTKLHNEEKELGSIDLETHSVTQLMKNAEISDSAPPPSSPTLAYHFSGNTELHR